MQIVNDDELRKKVCSIVEELNEFIDSGKWDIFGDKAEELINKHSTNSLLLVGCKICNMKGIKRYHLELPYRRIEEEDIEKILFRIKSIELS